MDVAKFRETKSLPVEYQGDTVNLKYRPGAFTPKFEASVRGATDNSILAKMLVALVAEWDLVDGGKPYPLTEESLIELPTPFLVRLVEAISEDAVPNPSSGSGPASST